MTWNIDLESLQLSKLNSHSPPQKNIEIIKDPMENMENYRYPKLLTRHDLHFDGLLPPK